MLLGNVWEGLHDLHLTLGGNFSSWTSVLYLTTTLNGGGCPGRSRVTLLISCPPSQSSPALSSFLGFAFYFQFDPVMKRDRKSGSREHAKLTKQGGREACLVAKEKSQTQTVIGY